MTRQTRRYYAIDLIYTDNKVSGFSNRKKRNFFKDVTTATNLPDLYLISRKPFAGRYEICRYDMKSIKKDGHMKGRKKISQFSCNIFYDRSKFSNILIRLSVA